jgi:aminoglycoside phosphotransferase (APT) family kinase protein
VHGDFAPENVLVTPDGKQLTGIIDWELAEPNGVPLLDLMQLFVAARAEAQSQEFGAVVCALLNSADWLPHEHKLLKAAQAALPTEPLDLRTLLQLCWLKHAASNLTKSARYANHWIWLRQNVECVLHLF